MSKLNRNLQLLVLLLVPMLQQAQNAFDKGSTLDIVLALDTTQTTGKRYPSLQYTITNHRNRPLRLYDNNGIDLENSEDRLVYCEIEKDGEPYLEWKKYRVFVRQGKLTREDIVVLDKGQSMSSSFSLIGAYQLNGAGIYRVRVIYDPKANPLLGIRKHKPVYSNWIELRMVD